ncbi:class I SAM-dependent methyltransferase [Kutzneria sp. 744]|uniref:class I SAM-dependent methyltransferase n=1 Tax=Kutzneria sp. (strain 744) TaxID=345341 RepID=UPI0003EEC975|nr:class I SAM-dependent methyltransferase [Kutzneria sp. 744]EWM11385.1 ubiquinone/menaquinone biosynthesis methyltransferase [Kutzneria sp. 744]
MVEPAASWTGDMPQAYARWLVPAVFQPFAVDLARRASAHAPRRVLELAAGTGVLTRELVVALPHAEVTATDLNEDMVQAGRLLVPQAAWQQTDAMHLPFDDARYDLVACQFGVMFLPDKPAAFAEARRVLTPDGTALVNTWDTLDSHDFQRALVAALVEVFPDDPPTFMGTVPHGYADVDRVVSDLEAGGMRCVAVDSVTLEGHAESVAGLAAGYCTGTPLRAEIQARGDLADTTAAVADRMVSMLGEGPVVGRMAAHVVEATPAA